MNRHRLILWLFDLGIASFTIVRLSLEYLFRSKASEWFANGPAPYTEKLFDNWVIPYSWFPDILKEKIFVFMVVWPYFLVRFIPWLVKRSNGSKSN